MIGLVSINEHTLYIDVICENNNTEEIRRWAGASIYLYTIETQSEFRQSCYKRRMFIVILKITLKILQNTQKEIKMVYFVKNCLDF